MEQFQWCRPQTSTPIPPSRIGVPSLDASDFLDAAARLAADLASEVNETAACAILVERILDAGDIRRAVLLVQNFEIVSDGRQDGLDRTISQQRGSISSRDLPIGLLNEAIEGRHLVRWSAREGLSGDAEYVIHGVVEEAFCLPLIASGELVGLLYVEMALAAAQASQIVLDFLTLAACQGAAFLRTAQSEERRTESDRSRELLQSELDDLHATSSRMSLLGRGGRWSWRTQSGSMSFSPELERLLWPSGTRAIDRDGIWSLTVDNGKIPPKVLAAISRNAAFEAEIEILRPSDEIITTIFIAGEPTGSNPGEYQGFALDIGPRGGSERCADERSQVLVTFGQKIADPLTSILLSANAAERWLWNDHLDVTSIQTTLKHIIGSASLITDHIKNAPADLERSLSG